MPHTRDLFERSADTKVAYDHWADPGGRSLAALKQFSQGATDALLTVEFVDTVDELRRAVFQHAPRLRVTRLVEKKKKSKSASSRLAVALTASTPILALIMSVPGLLIH